jgi:hypothetical protein
MSRVWDSHGGALLMTCLSGNVAALNLENADNPTLELV